MSATFSILSMVEKWCAFVAFLFIIVHSGTFKMVKGDTKCFSSGSSAPAIKPDIVTLYGMRFCPYAERARITLEAKEIPFDIININLKSKPEWFLQRNPFGKVPTIEEPDHKITYESLIVVEYLDDKFQSGLKLLPIDHHERAKQKMLFELIREKFLSKFDKAQFQGKEEDKKAFVDGLIEVEKLLQDKFFAGPSVGYVDLMIWPWMYRSGYMPDLRGIEIPKDKLPKITDWTYRMHQLSFIKSTIYPLDLMCEFAKDYGKMQCDLGL